MSSYPVRGSQLPLVAAIALWLANGAAAAATISPSNLPPGFCDLPQSSNLVQSGNRTFNTNTECTTVVTPAGAPALCVIAFNQITIGSAATIQASGTRLLALVARTSFVLQGSVDVSSTGSPGPSPGLNGNTGGGGGGGNAQAGGAGGPGASPGAFGGIAAGVATLSPLTTGSRGGTGGAGGSGGAGGGAIQFVSCGSFMLDSGAVVRANGLGGTGGNGGGPQSDGNGGGGGGSGGSILIEADTVDLLGRVLANGGGGGGGGSGGTLGGTGDNGGPGGLGSFTSTNATGGSGGGTAPTGGGGGSGAAGSPGSGGTSGDDGTFATGGGGGGGGAQGRIRINRCASLANTAIVVSPPPSLGNSCEQLFANGFE